MTFYSLESKSLCYKLQRECKHVEGHSKFVIGCPKKCVRTKFVCDKGIKYFFF